MPLDMQILDAELLGFSPEARALLALKVLDYAKDLIAEANRIESLRNVTAQPREVIAAFVSDAAVSIERGLPARKRGIGWLILKVVAFLLGTVSGVMYDAARIQASSTYLLFFLFLMAASLLAMAISTSKE